MGLGKRNKILFWPSGTGFGEVAVIQSEHVE